MLAHVRRVPRSFPGLRPSDYTVGEQWPSHVRPSASSGYIICIVSDSFRSDAVSPRNHQPCSYWQSVDLRVTVAKELFFDVHLASQVISDLVKMNTRQLVHIGVK